MIFVNNILEKYFTDVFGIPFSISSNALYRQFLIPYNPHKEHISRSTADNADKGVAPQ
jgi:hypothetical protein